jgi:hypothetical protein
MNKVLINRQTNGATARKAALQQRAEAVPVSTAGVNPSLAGMNVSAIGGAGGQHNPLVMLNGQVLSNATELLSGNALRLDVGQIPMQQQQNHHLKVSIQFLPNTSTSSSSPQAWSVLMSLD